MIHVNLSFKFTVQGNSVKAYRNKQELEPFVIK